MTGKVDTHMFSRQAGFRALLGLVVLLSSTAFPVTLLGNDPAILPASVSGASTASAGGSLENQELHVLPGRSLIVNMQIRMQRVLVSNPSVVQTLTANPKQLVIMGKEPGASSVVVWDSSGGSRILDVNVDVDVTGLRDALRQAFPKNLIQVIPEQRRIFLSGSAPNKAAADEMIRIATIYAKDVVSSIVVAQKQRPRQVLLKVQFAEVDRSKLDQFGINILSTGAANTIGTVSSQQFAPPGLGSGELKGNGPGSSNSLTLSDLLNVFIFRPDLNLGLTLRDLQQKNVLQILAEPNLLAIDGEPAKFLAGGEFPFPVVQGGGSVANTAVTIQFRPFGVQLQFVATIEDDDLIRLKVAPEVSALDFSNAITISGFVVPAISTRRAETEVELRNGQSFGIAGMLDHRTTVQLSKLPGIGDVPVLGSLFRSKSINNTFTELVVIVTPTVVDPVSSVSAAALPQRVVPLLDEKKYDKSISRDPKPPGVPDKRERND
jgi:pilus assembly protein CpaC